MGKKREENRRYSQIWKNTDFGAAFEAIALSIIRLIRYKLISISNKEAKRSLMENDSQQVGKSILLSVTEKDGMG